MSSDSTPQHDDRPARLARDVLRLFRRQVELSYAERLLLVVLADFADEEPTIADLERATTYAKTTITEHLKSLESKGWISRDRRPPKRTRYTLSAERIRQGASGAT